MGLDPEYTRRPFCQTAGCDNWAVWTVGVQWSFADFLDIDCCGHCLAYTLEYWQRFNVDGVEPEIWAAEIMR